MFASNKRLFVICGIGLLFGLRLLETPSPALANEMNEKPLWEIILFNGAVSLPQYPASDENQFYAFPLPYLIYRGEILKSTRQGVKGVLFETDLFEWTVSLTGNPPVDNDNDARQGMAELDALFGIGPSVKMFLTGRNAPDRLYLQTSFRLLNSIGLDDFNLTSQGCNGELELNYKNRSLLSKSRTRFGFSMGIGFSDSKLNGYYYDVPEHDVLADRAAYEADGGYSGFHMSASIMSEISGRMSAGSYFRWNNYDRAVFNDSPLARDNNNFTIGCALIFTLIRSDRTIVTYESDE